MILLTEIKLIDNAMKITPIIIYCCLVFIARVAYADNLTFHTNHEYAFKGLALSRNEQLWLSQQKSISIGIVCHNNSPLCIINNKELSGLDAEYIGLLKNTLNTDITITSCKTISEAYTALNKGDIDLVINHINNNAPIGDDTEKTRPYLYSYPTMITKSEISDPAPNVKELSKIAVAKKDYEDDFASKHFSNVTIINFQEVDNALLSVVNGEADAFIGNTIEVSYSLSKNLFHDLRQVKTWNDNEHTQSFVIKKGNNQLKKIINKFIISINPTIYEEIFGIWIDNKKLMVTDGPISLTKQEKEWISKQKPLRVIINPYNFPFSMTDAYGNIRGITGELLDFISIKTGLKFLPVFSNSNIDTKKIVESGQWDLHPAIIYSEERSKKAIFSKEYISSPFVLVLNKNKSDLRDLSKKMTVAITAHHSIEGFIKSHYKNLNILKTVNSSEAIKLLQDGKVDAAITTQLTAEFYTAHYTSDSIVYFPIPNAPQAKIGFAFPKTDYILKEIIDKTLQGIPAKQMRRLAENLTGISNLKIDTWNIYKTEFYQVVFFSLTLIISSIFWGVYLLREIRKRKISEADIKDQLSFSSTLSSSVPYPIYIITLEGELINCNPAFNNFFSYPSSFSLDANLSSTNHPLHHLFCAMCSAISLNASTNSVVTLTNRISNGIEYRNVVHWFTTFNSTEGNIPLLICGWSDITEHSMLMDALRRESKNAMVAKEAKGEFLARMSHELRTPLSAIIGLLELIRLQYPDNENIELAFNTGSSLLSLIGEVLDLEKIESGKYDIQEEWFDIDALLMEIVKMFEALASQKGLNIILKNDIADKIMLLSAPQAIRQILTNLIGNAIKFTEKGSVIINAEIINDQGFGILLEEQQKLFKLFSQTSSSKNTNGSGLGLFICQQIVKILSGKIYLSKSNHTGSTFTVEIPVKTSSNKKLNAEVINTIAAPKKINKIRILIADDNPTNRLLIKKQLLALGYNADEASDGKQAFDYLQKCSYDLLITDINMPVLDGIELTKTIRCFNTKLTIWGLTANLRTEERDACIAAGMQLVLFKPLKLDELSTLLLTLKPENVDPVLEEIFDIGKVISLAMGSNKLVLEMLKHSRDECQRDMHNLSHASTLMDINAIKRCTHRILGSAHIIGAESIANICDKIESDILNGIDTQILLDKIELLSCELEMLFTDLDKKIKEYESR